VARHFGVLVHEFESVSLSGKTYGREKMRISVAVLGSLSEPYLHVHHEHAAGMLLRRSSSEVGLWRSEVTRVTYGSGEWDRACVIGNSGLEAPT
jgi:hypothetical protein